MGAFTPKKLICFTGSGKQRHVLTRGYHRLPHVESSAPPREVQEVSVGRTVHVPNLGLFFQGGPGQMRFKAGGGVHVDPWLGRKLLGWDDCWYPLMR